MNGAKQLTIVAAAAWAGLVAAPAGAFLCTRAGIDGPSLAWEPRTISIERSGAGAEIASVEVDRVLLASMASWNDLACSDVALVPGAPTLERLAGFDWAAGSGREGNENILVFRNDQADDPVDAWLHQLGALAITTVTFESNRGELLDADIEVNDTSFSFTACSPDDLGCTVAFDLENTLTHELGHVLGLDHSAAGDATMFASAPRGDLVKRTLSFDDEDAVCAVYPAGGPLGECFGVPRQDPPDVRFTPTVCGAGGAGPTALCLLGLRFARRRTRRGGG